MKKLVTIVSLCVLLLIVGCDSDTTPTIESVFDGGTQGIVAKFEPFGIEEDGVFTIFDSENFPIEVVLQNNGEEDVEEGDVIVKLRGINLEDFTGIISENLTNEGLLEKISEFNPDGEEEVIDFTPNDDAQYILNVTGFFQPDIFAFVEYEYKTHVIVPKVCYKEDPRDDDICETQEAKDFFVSGAPVTVRSVEQDIAGRGVIVLTIEIENAGSGKVTLPGEDFDVRFGQVGLTMETDQDEWECRSGGREDEARLVNGRATVICRLREPLEADTLFTKQVELTLDYKYQTIIQQAVRIKESIE